MPYCTQCGNKVGDHDIFCALCGAKQGIAPGATQPPPGAPFAANDFLGNINSRTASVLCYIPVVGWIPAICVLASARFRHDRDTRFHAFQGLYLFVAWLMVDWVLKPVFHFSSMGFGFPFIGIFKALLFGAWIWMIVKVTHNETFKLPLLGELAEKSVAEQR